MKVHTNNCLCQPGSAAAMSARFETKELRYKLMIININGLLVMKVWDNLVVCCWMVFILIISEQLSLSRLET